MLVHNFPLVEAYIQPWQKFVWLRGGQTFPKFTEFRNSITFRPFFAIYFCAFQSVVAESVSEQLLHLPWRTNVLGSQFWVNKVSMSMSATETRISAPICTKYGLQKSVHGNLMDCTLYVKSLANTYIRFRKFLMGHLWPSKQAVLLKRNKTGGCFVWGRPEGWATAVSSWRDVIHSPTTYLSVGFTRQGKEKTDA